MVGKINPAGNVYPLKKRKKRPSKEDFKRLLNKPPNDSA